MKSCTDEENNLHTTNYNFTILLLKIFLLLISKRGCEWPEGHPDEPEFHFCNKERFEDKPYCLDHCAVAYVIPEKEEALNQWLRSGPAIGYK